MDKTKPLFLYEEIMLLALRDQEGTISTNFPEHVIAGAILAELLLDGHISVENSRKQFVELRNTEPTEDPIIDECLERIASSKRRGSLQTWVSRLASIKNLRHKAAHQLCDRGILRAEQDKILFIFKRRIYPEINPIPEKEIINRLKAAIFTDHDQVDPRTVVLVSLADGSGLLSQTFGYKEIEDRKKRIEKIATGELSGKATKEVIIACQTAILIAVIMPTLISTTIQS